MSDQLYPALSRTSVELLTVFDDLDRRLSALFEETHVLSIRKTLETLMSLERKIGLFFRNIRNLLTGSHGTVQEDFIARFFFKQYSIISENTRAAKNIIRYVLGDIGWFTVHSGRIIEVLKTLYAELLTLQIECREQYKRLTGEEMGSSFDFTASGEILFAAPAMTFEEALSVLSLEDTATKENIKTAFRRLAKTLHPDLNPAASKEDFIRAETAYRTLQRSFPAV